MRRRDHVVCLRIFPELHPHDKQHAKDNTAPVYLHKNFVKLPLLIRVTDGLCSLFPHNICSKHQPETVPPKPDCLMTYIATTLMKKVLHISERKRKTNAQHDCKSDDFRASFKVAEWRVFCHPKTLQISTAR